ncbi:MerR HTH family regulatory protein [Hydrocarboniphaga daqingensis]|uniref:MerR HTH family regulatory protein n=1 Tax=Hydrocarboniphaga daqingensis TaxID=490188 RepID=A0A1M5M291_9GAMM|nr:MerR family transcriptional regulator [Hydrocarboniphaga daqingensis]SHG71395.1 MerR HTH family regulatory protein [Hydrocarboniphaga daqingensis]
MNKRRFFQRNSADGSSGSGDDSEPDRADGGVIEYSIDELARAASTTVRNVRAYQDRGLLPPPERRGRVGIYGESHLSRLRIIGQLLARGFTLVSIGELINAWESGSDLGGLLGLESAVSSPWGDEKPIWLGLPALVDMFGGAFDPRWLVRASELGVIVLDGVRFRVPSPRLLQAGAELVKLGIPLDEMLEVLGSLRANVEAASDQMVMLVERHLFDGFGKGLPPASEASRLGEIVWKLRPLVESAVQAEVARAMEQAATRHLGDRLAHILAQFQASKAGDPPR